MAHSFPFSPSKKLLITDPKPKPGPSSASSSSSTITPPAPEKRTRDQPNFSDCHCCGSRIKSISKDRLQPMDSVWRIVLLCRKCRKSVSSGQTCPYCFQITGNSGDLCICRACKRKIHKDCVRDYGKCTPWCYLGAGFEGFRVCVDCWVPELLKDSVQCGLKEKGEGKDLLENAEQNEKCEVGMKVMNVKAKDQESRRGEGGIDDGDLVYFAADLLAKNDRDSLKAETSNCSGEIEATDDTELAIKLHRVMNSSPRILRGMPLAKSNDDASKIRNWKGLSYKRSGLGKRCSEDQKLDICANSTVNGRIHQTVENDSNICFSGLSLGVIPYRRDRKRRIWSIENENTEISGSTSSQQAALKNLHSYEGGVECSDEAVVGCSLNGSNTSEDPSCDNIWQSNSCTDAGRFAHELISYKRTRFKKKVSQMNGLIGVSGDSSPCGNHGVAFKSKTEDIFPSGSSGTEQDRYHLKYVKRIPGTKIDSSFLRYGAFHAADRYLFKYAKRVKSSNSSSNSEAKLHANAFLDKISISATRLTTNCSAESRTPSGVPFDSFTVDLPQ